MKRDPGALAAAAALMAALTVAGPTAAQKQGGILRAGHFDSPASMSMLEESTLAVNRPVMGVFNNLVMFDQQVAQNSPQSIVPDLATGWSWNEEGTELTMPLRRDVKWHDGRPFSAKDVKCTWDLLTGRGNDKLRINPRKSWYDNLDAVTTNGDFEVTFRLKRPQPSFLTLLASGWSPAYPCHVPSRDMRLHPIGTGPFKFVEFKPNVSITLVRNPDYWKPGRPFLEGIEWTIVKDVSTRLLSFIAGRDDVYFGVTIPQLQDVKREVPEAICDSYLVNGSRNLIVNRAKPPFDNPDLRRAMSLTLDRQAFIDIISAGRGAIGGPMEPPPEGLWSMPAEMLKALPGYSPDVARRRAEARQIMEKLGYGPDNGLRSPSQRAMFPPGWTRR
jgi:peptide/nickel transport system substrate-binding protein